jgi:hypothetical protein
MSTPAPDALLRLIDRFDQDRKVFLSGDYKEEQLPKAKSPHGQESLRRPIAATERDSISPRPLDTGIAAGFLRR